MKFVDFKINKEAAQKLLDDLEILGVEELDKFINFLETAKPRLDDIIDCGGIAGSILEIADGKVLDMGADALINLLNKLKTEMQTP